MGVHKIKKGPYYYADYYDFNGVRRRISLQTENKKLINDISKKIVCRQETDLSLIQLLVDERHATEEEGL